MDKDYIFTSERLGFRNWTRKDLPDFAALNADPEVMEHLPKPLTEKESEDFLSRLQKHYEQWGFNYFATEILRTGEQIGFIGLAYQDYQAAFTPAVDIGWRLKRSAWGKGYATEGAKRCVDYAFNELDMDRIISTCTKSNSRSELVMCKIGMTKKGTFLHPKLKDFPNYQKCVWYELKKE